MITWLPCTELPHDLRGHTGVRSWSTSNLWSAFNFSDPRSYQRGTVTMKIPNTNFNVLPMWLKGSESRMKTCFNSARMRWKRKNNVHFATERHTYMHCFNQLKMLSGHIAEAVSCATQQRPGRWRSSPCLWRCFATRVLHSECKWIVPLLLCRRCILILQRLSLVRRTLHWKHAVRNCFPTLYAALCVA